MDKLKKLIIFNLIFLINNCSLDIGDNNSSQGQIKSNVFQEEVDQQILQIIPQKPVRITLKRTVKGNYSWELRGEDIKEIIKIDKKLKEYIEEK